MIVDKIENADMYAVLGKRLAQGLKLMKDPEMLKKAPGKYEVDGENLFYLIQSYTTKDKKEMLFEAHKNYIDIQAVLDGAETIGYAPADTLKVIEPYQPDVYKCADPDVFTEVKLPKGTFGIFYPNDAHKPCYDYKGKGPVFKLVVKVKV